VLDFATGTGRLSYALLSQAEFKGRIVAVDLSQGMLEQAASKLGLLTAGEGPTARAAPPDARVELLRHQSLPLPFPEAAFDAVCALEVLELFPNMEEPLHELIRVLRPGGILLTSRGTEESGRKAKVKSKGELTALLERSGLVHVQITKWWRLFDRVMATKDGTSNPVSLRKLTEVMRCSACNQIKWQETAGALKCRSCGKELSVTDHGIVLN
jgi:ubiquinone/menaquinone biosynthesis C-methylase UbiE